jgi:hypothetical protein
VVLSPEEFRYEAVAVVRNNLSISSLQGLRGLKSCHTGVGRNVGYKIPITKVSTASRRAQKECAVVSRF